MEGRRLPGSLPLVDPLAVEPNAVYADGTRRECRSRGPDGLPGLAALRTPRGIEEDQTKGFGKSGKGRGLLPCFVREYRHLRGKGDGADG